MLMASVMLMFGCSSISDSLVESHGPLEDRDREKEFAELEQKSQEMQKSSASARREARNQIREQSR